MKSLSSIVRETIKSRRLMDGVCRVVVGVSGGADSVALLHVLHSLRDELGIELTVAHLDHGIRGKTARRDAAFVEKMCRQLQTPCVTGNEDVPALARRHGWSLEMAGRFARHAFFTRAAREAGAEAVATAHTADDQAETILLRLARGAGSAGLAGIRHRIRIGGLWMIRPLLDAARSDVVRFLDTSRIEWVEDESNTDMKFLRNRVRHRVLPFLEEQLNPKVREALLRAGEVLRAEDEWLDSLAGAMLARCGTAGRPELLRTGELLNETAAARRRVVRLWLAANDVPPDLAGFAAVDRVDRLAAVGPGRGRCVPVGGGWQVRRLGHGLELSRGPARKARFRRVVGLPGETKLPDQGLRVATEIRPGIVRPARATPGDLPACASLSLAAVGRRKLYVRSWRPGDRMRPLGATGSRKLQDIFVDAKVPREERAGIPLLECGGEVVWIPGYRVAHGWQVVGSGPAVQVFIGRI